MSAASVNDTPTRSQHRRLLALGSGAALVAASDREIRPLYRRGWVTGKHQGGGAYPWSWVRITPAGLSALARSVERYGLPTMTFEAPVRADAPGPVTSPNQEDQS